MVIYRRKLKSTNQARVSHPSQLLLTLPTPFLNRMGSRSGTLRGRKTSRFENRFSIDKASSFEVEAELQESLQRDTDTLGLLYRHFVFQIFRYARSRGLSEPDAEDLAHETILRANAALKSFRFGEPMWPWLASITKNHLIDVCRRDSKSIPVDEFEELGDEAGFEEEIDRRGRARLTARALSQLQADDARIVYLRDFDGKSYEEISEHLGLSLGAVRSKLFRARRHLKKEVIRQRLLDPSLPGWVAWPSIYALIRRLVRSGRVREASGLSFGVLALAGMAAVSIVATTPVTVSKESVPPPAARSSTNILGPISQIPPRAALIDDHRFKPGTVELVTPGIKASVPVAGPKSDDGELRIEIGSIAVTCSGLGDSAEAACSHAARALQDP